MAMAASMERALPPIVSPSAWSDTPYHKMITNVVLALGAFIPVLLELLPMIFLLISRSLERTVQLFHAPVMVASVVNCAIWLLFTLVSTLKEDASTTINEDKSTELVISYPIVLVSNYLYLLLVCFHYNRPIRGMMLSTFLLPFTAYIFYACRFGTALVEQYEDWIGFSGLLALILFHALTILDMEIMEGFLDYLLMVLNIIPTGLLSGATFIVLSKQTQPPPFVLLASEIGAAFFLLEVSVMIAHYMKHNCGGGGHDHVGNNDNDHPDPGALGGHQVQNHGENNGEDNAHVVAAEGGQHPLGHPAQHFGQALLQHELEVVIQHDGPDNLAGLNDQVVAAELGASHVSTELNCRNGNKLGLKSDGDVEDDSSSYFSFDDDKTASLGITDGDVEDDASFDGSETETVAHDFRTVTIQDIPQTTPTVSITPVNQKDDIPRTQGVPVVSPPRGLCCGFACHRRRLQVQKPIA